MVPLALRVQEVIFLALLWEGSLQFFKLVSSKAHGIFRISSHMIKDGQNEHVQIR